MNVPFPWASEVGWREGPALKDKWTQLNHKGATMKRLGKSVFTVIAILSVTSIASAWDTSMNPDRVPSLGWGLDAGRIPGLESRYAKFTQFSADGRLPLNNYLTLNLDVSDTTMQNVPNGVNTDAYRVGVKVRIYLHDLK